MQTEFLYEFIAVARFLNFRKAAEASHVSTSAISKHISSLEKELGFQLFEREGGTRLTPAGEHFYARVTHVLEELEDSIDESREIAREAPPARVLWFGQEGCILEGIAPKIKTPFSPVVADPATTHLSSLESGQADIVRAINVDSNEELASRIEQEGFASVVIGENPMSLTVSRSNPLAEKASLSREDLRDAEFLVPYGAISDYASAGANGFFGADLNIKVRQEPSLLVGLSGVPIRDLGDYIILNNLSAAQRVCEERSDLVVFDALDGRPLIGKEYLIFRPNDPNPNVKAFVEEVLAITRQEKERAGEE